MFTTKAMPLKKDVELAQLMEIYNDDQVDEIMEAWIALRKDPPKNWRYYTFIVLSKIEYKFCDFNRLATNIVAKKLFEMLADFFREAASQVDDEGNIQYYLIINGLD